VENNWRSRAKQFGDSLPELSKKVKKQIGDTAPDVSKRVRQQIQVAAPVVSHRVHEVGKALTAPMPNSAAVNCDSPMTEMHNEVPQLPRSENARSTSVFSPTQNPPSRVRTAANSTTMILNRPVAVHVAYLALAIAAVGSAILAGLGVYGLNELRGSVDKVTHLDPTGTVAFYSNGYIDNAETMLMSSAVGLGTVFALAYALVALAVRKGHGWPRPVGTVLAVLSLPMIFLGPVALVIVVAGIVAVLALWTRGARQYAVQTKAAKSMARAR
jgi:type IV secretory pathway VirB2 component (pilin)